MSDDDASLEPIAGEAAPQRAAEGANALEDPAEDTVTTATPEERGPRRAVGEAESGGASVPIGRTTDVGAVEPTKPPARKRRKLTATSLIGLLLLALGLGSLGYMGWQYYGTNITSAREANKGKETLRQRWDQERKSPRATAQETMPDGSVRVRKPPEGDWVALIRIPALGDDYEWPVIAGVNDEVLAKGIGWYTETAMPGQVGNFAVAGHRITHGEPFAKLLELNKGDKVIVETRDAIYTYELYTAPRDQTVKNTDVWVIDPVPGKKGEKPTEALLTLTTCTNLFASPERSVAFGKLIDKKPV